MLVVDVRESASGEGAAQALLARFGVVRHPRLKCGCHIPFRSEYVDCPHTLMFFSVSSDSKLKRELEQRGTRRTRRHGGTRLR